MNPMPDLSPMLKQLRLSGILDSLETRNREAIQNKLAYPEFLALLPVLAELVVGGAELRLHLHELLNLLQCAVHVAST